jgi:hypothetical protein
VFFRCHSLETIKINNPSLLNIGVSSPLYNKVKIEPYRPNIVIEDKIEENKIDKT